MSDKAAGQKARSPEGCDENGPAAALLLSHVSIQICSFLGPVRIGPPCRRPILIATPLHQSLTWCTSKASRLTRLNRLATGHFGPRITPAACFILQYSNTPRRGSDGASPYQRRAYSITPFPSSSVTASCWIGKLTEFAI